MINVVQKHFIQMPRKSAGLLSFAKEKTRILLDVAASATDARDCHTAQYDS